MQMRLFDGIAKDDLAIQLIQAYQHPTIPFYGGFSGGIDSQIIYDLAQRANTPVEWHYHVSPIDPPQTRQFIKERYPDVTWDYYAKGFFGKPFISNGLPLRTQRWCCGLIKECGGEGRVCLLGMRRDESNSRSTYSCFDNTLPHGKSWLLPIVDWTHGDRQMYIAERHITVNPIYALGFTRTGCILCPFQNKDDVALSLYHFPKIANLWRQAADRYIRFRWKTEGRKKPTFANGEEYFNWWIRR